MKLCLRGLFAIGGIAFSAAGALGQSLLVNGTFDTNYSGWGRGGWGDVRWVADDCCGNGGSGSVGLGQFEWLTSNCIEVTEGTSYDLTLWSKFAPIPIIQPPESNALAQPLWSTGATCADFFAFPTGPEIPLGNNADWMHIGATFVAPVGAHRAQVVLFVSNCGLSCGGTTYFDSVAFGPAGTVPVELQSFEID